MGDANQNVPAGGADNATATEERADEEQNEFWDGIERLNAKSDYDQKVLKDTVLFYDDLQDRRLKRQNDQILFMQTIRERNSQFVTEQRGSEQSLAHRDIAIATEWDTTATDIMNSGSAMNAVNKTASEVSPTIPGPSTSPGVAGSGVNAQSGPTQGS